MFESKWFRFGAVRGLIGMFFMLIIFAMFSSMILGLTMPVQQYTFGTTPSDNSFVPSLATWGIGIILVAIVFAGLISVFFEGFKFWLGNEVRERYLDVEVTGLRRAILNGIVGGLILTVFFVPLYFIAPTTGDTGTTILSIILSIPLFVIFEIIWTSITWGVYNLAEWETP